MRLQVQREEKIEIKETLELKLKGGLKGGEDCVYLTIVDAEGEPIKQGNILSITPHGTIALCTNVNSKCGLKLGDQGKVVLE